jgi:glycosyltransferase involved in cell wall biosynthesis
MENRLMGNNDGAVKISVIVNMFNTEKYLRRCLDSILSQTFTDFELILVDDCSTDGSPEICEEYAKKDGRIKVIHNERNIGCPQARKAGLDVACGDYILFADSDDWLENNMLELMYNKAASDDLDLVYCGIYRNTDNEEYELKFPFLYNKIEIIKELATWKNFPPAVWNKLVKHEILKKVIFPTFNVGEDVQISIQTIHYASKIGYIKNLLYHYYNNVNSLGNCISDRQYIDLYEISLWVINFISDNYEVYVNTFEPELSDYINFIKLPFVINKSIMDISKLHKLYSVSNKHIFNNTWHEALDNKVFFYLQVNHLSLLSYPVAALIHFAIKIYRLITPKKIRSIIWKNRMSINET